MLEWDRMLLKWIKIVNDFQSKRMEVAFYEPYRRSLVSAYWRYVTHPPPDAPTFDLLPHVSDPAHFPPFRDHQGFPRIRIISYLHLCVNGYPASC